MRPPPAATEIRFAGSDPPRGIAEVSDGALVVFGEGGALIVRKERRRVRGDGAATWEPHRLCGYLSGLAQAVTALVETCPVLRAPEPVRSNRLALCRLAAETLRTGLDLLGVAAPERL